MTTLDEKVALLAGAFAGAGVPYAFGGALALAYYAEPRGTIDVDVNVFVDAGGAGAVLDLLAPLGVGVRKRETLVRIRRDGQVRLIWDETPLDLFFAHDPFHASVAERVRDVPFADQTITILSPEDLVVFKAAFGRRKDWIDIEQVVFTTAGDFDLTYTLSWAERIVGAEDRRLAALREAIERILGEGATG